MIQLLSQIIFYLPYLGTSVVLIILCYLSYLKPGKFHRFLNIAVLLTIAFFLLLWTSQLLSLYLSLRFLPSNDVLLFGKDSFFMEKSFAVSTTFIKTLSLAILLYIATLILKMKQINSRVQKNTYFNNFTAKVVLIITLSLGFSNVLPWLLIAFLSFLIFWFFSLFLPNDDLDRANIIPSLLIGALIVRVLMIFPFYSYFLGLLRLI